MEIATIQLIQSANEAIKSSTKRLSSSLVKGRSFLEELSTAQSSRMGDKPAVIHVVKKNDTLSQICRDFLKKNGTVTTAQIYTAVDKVAKANKLRNPNLILVNQKLDISVLAKPAEKTELAVAPIVKAPVKIMKVKSESRPVTEATPALSKDLPINMSKMIQFILDSEAGIPSTKVSSSNVLSGPSMISSDFGSRKGPISGKWGHHNGIDLAANHGTHIYPLKSGTIAYSGWKVGYGKIVIVQHDDGMETVYAHNSSNMVNVGDRVTSSTPIGRVGSTGHSTGPHLHFEVREFGRPVDPKPYYKSNTLGLARRY